MLLYVKTYFMLFAILCCFKWKSMNTLFLCYGDYLGKAVDQAFFLLFGNGDLGLGQDFKTTRHIWQCCQEE